MWEQEPDALDAMLSRLDSPAGRRLADALIGYFSATLENAFHIPSEGGALLVSNHATFGIDAFVLTALVWRERRRYPRFLVERNLARLPPIRFFFRKTAVLPGSQDAAVAALSRGELVGVYPGGIDESLKLERDRNRILWGTRDGFARAAVRAQVPIVPVAGVGIDDMYRVVAREPWIGRRVLGSARYDLPIAFGAFGSPIPRRARMRFVVLPPIGPMDDVEKLRARAHAAIDGVLARERHGSPT